MNARQRGFTIVEVMVAMTISLVISAVVVTMFATTSRTQRVTSAVAVLQEGGRIVTDTLQRDARMVGYRGCNSNNVGGTAPISNVLSTPTAYLNGFDTGIQGYEATGGTWSPGLPGSVSAPGAPVPGALTPGSDVLVMRVVTGAPVALSATMGSVSAPIPVQAGSALAADTRLIVADCARATVFYATDLTGGMIAHTTTGGFNASGNLSRAYGEDASVMPFETHAYFVAPSIRDPVNQRSLWLKVDDQAPVEVVENVESMQLQYGEDTDADYVPNVARTADAVTNWSNVIAMQVSLLLRGEGTSDNQATTNYVFNGATVVPTDRRLRRVYTTTIELRNRTL